MASPGPPAMTQDQDVEWCDDYDDGIALGNFVMSPARSEASNKRPPPTTPRSSHKSEVEDVFAQLGVGKGKAGIKSTNKKKKKKKRKTQLIASSEFGRFSSISNSLSTRPNLSQTESERTQISSNRKGYKKSNLKVNRGSAGGDDSIRRESDEFAALLKDDPYATDDTTFPPVLLTDSKISSTTPISVVEVANAQSVALNMEKSLPPLPSPAPTPTPATVPPSSDPFGEFLIDDDDIAALDCLVADHTSHSQSKKDNAEQKASSTTTDFRPGDWKCSSCGVNNFAKRTVCFKPSCLGKKPIAGQGGNPLPIKDDPFNDPFDDEIMENYDFSKIDEMISMAQQQQQRQNQSAAAPPPPQQQQTSNPKSFHSPVPTDIEDTVGVPFGNGTPFKSVRTFSQQQLSQPNPTSQCGWDPNEPVRNERCPADSGFMSFSRYRIVSFEDYMHIQVKELKVVPCQDGQTDAGAKVVYLHGDWYWSPIKCNDIFNIVSPSGSYLTSFDVLPITFTTAYNPKSDVDDLLFVLRPETVLSPSYVVEHIGCPRKAALKHRFKGSTSERTEAQLVGNLRHDLFQKCLVSNDVSDDSMQKIANQLVYGNIEELLSCDDLPQSRALSEVLSIKPHVQEFSRMYGAPLDGNGKSAAPKGEMMPGMGCQDINFRATSVFAVEEQYYIPALGLEGYVDLTLETQYSSVSPSTSVAPSSRPKVLIPLELKTGKKQDFRNDHLGQLSLYTLMTRAFHGDFRAGVGEQVGGTRAGLGGVLLYMNGDDYKNKFLSPTLGEHKTLISMRNELVGNICESEAPRDAESGVAVLPPINNTAFQCSHCFSKRECMLYKASERIGGGGEGGEEEDWKIEMVEKRAGHLSDEHLKYFMDWDRMIDLEMSEEHRNMSSAWLIPSALRESKEGSTVSGVTWDRLAWEEQKMQAYDEGCTLKFERASGGIAALPLKVDDRLVVSPDYTTTSTGRGQFFVAKGEVKEIEDTHIVLKCQREAGTKMAKLVGVTLFRLDHDIWKMTGGALRENLGRLFKLTDPDGNDDIKDWMDDEDARRLREIVVDLKKPRFRTIGDDHLFEGPAVGRGRGVPGCDFEDLMFDFSCQLNDDQKNSVRKIVSMEDYCLVQGLPGTGKTSTVSFVVRLLVARGMSVLVTSYTHTAVDNLMMKLLECGVGKDSGEGDVVRVGVSSRHKYSDEIKGLMCREIAEKKYGKVRGGFEGESMIKVIDDARVVGCTCLSVGKEVLLAKKKFDVVIVDEAGQISQPAVLGALSMGKTFVLVGDHKQLPPIVKNKMAREGGYDVSLLKRLAEANDRRVCEGQQSSLTQLAMQYRMHEDITFLCNEICYGGLLKCGNDAVRLQKIDYAEGWRSRVGGDGWEGWVSDALDPSRAVVMVNTGLIGGDNSESREGGQRREGGGRGGRAIINNGEVAVVNKLVRGLIVCGNVKMSDVGIISYFNAQVGALRNNEDLGSEKGLEISTIDTFQGRDKKIVIMSFVRSNKEGDVGQILKATERINVACSRAKMKLIMVGDLECLMKGSEVLRKVLGKVKENGWVVGGAGGEEKKGKENVVLSQGVDVPECEISD